MGEPLAWGNDCQSGVILLSKGTFRNVRGDLGCHIWLWRGLLPAFNGARPGIRDTAKWPAMYSQPLAAKHHLTHNVSSVEVEKFCSRASIFGKKKKEKGQ